MRLRRSRTVLTIVAAVLLGTLGVVTTTSASAPTSAATAASRPRTLNLIATVTQESFLDLGAQGFSQGDQIIEAADLTIAGRPVGGLGLTCTVTRAPSGATGPSPQVQCLITFALPDGQLTAQGLGGGAGETAFAITGGTGAYRHAGGSGTVLDQGGTAAITLTLADLD